MFFDLIEFLHRKNKFSENTWGPRPNWEMALDHLKEEVLEVEKEPHDLMEWVDLILLATDGAFRAGFSPEQIAEGLVEKEKINAARTWPDWRAVEKGKKVKHEENVLVPILRIQESAFGSEVIVGINVIRGTSLRIEDVLTDQMHITWQDEKAYVQATAIIGKIISVKINGDASPLRYEVPVVVHER